LEDETPPEEGGGSPAVIEVEPPAVEEPAQESVSTEVTESGESDGGS